MILLNCNQLAEQLERHATYVYAMKRAGYKFSHGNRTMLDHALEWIANNPDFRTTRYRIVSGRKHLKHPQPATADIDGELAHSNG